MEDGKTKIKDNQKFHRKIVYLDQVNSTNDYLRHISQREKSGTVVWAEKQKRGRGRRGHSWLSFPYKSLTFSMLLKPRCHVCYVKLFILIPALAVCQTLQKYGIRAQIKWPNDVLIHGKKVCGVLVDTVTEKSRVKEVILGIGLNVNQCKDDFPAEFDSVGSVYSETGLKLERQHLLEEIVENILAFSRDIGNPSKIDWLITTWNNNCVHINTKVECLSDKMSTKGFFKGVTSRGEAILKIDDKNEIQLDYDTFSMRMKKCF